MGILQSMPFLTRTAPARHLTEVCDRCAQVCDLALLTVEEEDFWGSDLRALEIIDTPELQSPIAVAGYPVGARPAALLPCFCTCCCE